MNNKKLYIYCHKSKEKKGQVLYSDVALVRSDNLEEAEIVLHKYFDDIEELFEVKFDDNRNIIIISDY